jgi:hypothetical protein
MTAGSSSFSGNLRVQAASSSGKLTVGDFGDTARAASFHGGSILVDGGAASEIIIGDGNVAYMSIQTTDDATAMKIRDFSGSADLVTIERASGNVGIGTSSPVAPVTINDKATISFNVNDFALGHHLYYDAAGNDRWERLSGYAGSALYQTAGTMVFYRTSSGGSTGDAVTPTESMRIDSSGNLLVGTQSTVSSYSVATFAGDQKGITIYHNGTTPNYRSIYSNSSSTLYFYNGSNEAYLTSAGAWQNASDARLKTNIRDIEYGLNTVLSSQPRHFERNDVEGTYIGFIAQEMQEVIPEVVSGDPEKQLGLDYGSLVAVAFKAIQEQQTIIDDLKSRLDSAGL